jgi:hypothetical protein
MNILLFFQLNFVLINQQIKLFNQDNLTFSLK